MNDCFYDPYTFPLYFLFYFKLIAHNIQFLDEANLLAEHIAILAAPGKVLVEGSPVALKHDLGKGYFMRVSFTVLMDINKLSIFPKYELLDTLWTLAPQTYLTLPSPSQGCYYLKTKDSHIIVIGKVLNL